jgi:hypothetical protein
VDEASDSDAFESLWQRLEASWEDDSQHRKFIAFCASQGALPEAGRRYRRVRDESPERRKQAERWIDAVLAAAVQNLQLTRNTEDPKATARPLRWLAFGLSGFLICYALLLLLRGSPQ